MNIIKKICIWIWNLIISIVKILDKYILNPISTVVNIFIDGLVDNFEIIIVIFMLIVGLLSGVIISEFNSLGGMPKNKELRKLYWDDNIYIKEHNFNSKYSIQRYFIVESKEEKYQEDLKEIESYINFLTNKGWVQLPPIITIKQEEYDDMIISEYRFVKGVE